MTKFVIIIPDGCADEPQASLDGKTPLEAANIPNMDAIAQAGQIGRANHVPQSLPPGSDVANLSLLGYDPMVHYTGRAALEAAAQGIVLGPNDWAIRCNLVTILDQVMKDFTAGHISSEEARQLIEALQQELGSPQLQFYPGVSYRNLLIYRGGDAPAPFSRDTTTVPPHDLTDQSVLDAYPRGPGSDLLTRLMCESEQVLADHPVNLARKKADKLPATNIWLWGLGGAIQLPAFQERYGVSGAMITAVDLLRGLASLFGWRQIEVPGATGYLDTDYAAKGQYAIDALTEADLVCVHIEATDEAAHEGNTEAKIRALEEIDAKIVGPVWEALKRYADYRILVSPDHPTPLRLKTHAHGYVPFAIAGSGIKPQGAKAYSEKEAETSGMVFEEGWRVMGFFLGQPQ